MSSSSLMESFFYGFESENQNDRLKIKDSSQITKRLKTLDKRLKKAILKLDMRCEM